MIELRHFRYFVAVADELSFSHAAARLHITQPALSRQIQALEHEVGGALFERTNRRVVLTAIGDALLEEARATLERADRAMLAGSRAVRGMTGSCRLAFATPMMLGGFLPQLIYRFRSEWPSVDVDLIETTPSRQIVALREGMIDLGLLSIDASESLEGRLEGGAGLEHVILWSEDIVAAVSDGHALAGRGTIRLADLRNEPMIAFPPGMTSAHSGPFARLERLRGAPLRVAQRTDSIVSMVALAAGGLGVALLPRSMSRVRIPRLRYLAIRDERRSRHVMLVHPRSPRKPAAHRMIELTRSMARSFSATPPKA